MMMIIVDESLTVILLINKQKKIFGSSYESQGFPDYGIIYDSSELALNEKKKKRRMWYRSKGNLF